MKSECRFVEVFGKERYEQLRPVIDWAYEVIPKILEKTEWELWQKQVAGLAQRDEWKIIFNEVLKDIVFDLDTREEIKMSRKIPARRGGDKV